MLTSSAGARDDVPRIVIVLTDGKSSDSEATKVRSVNNNLRQAFYKSQSSFEYGGVDVLKIIILINIMSTLLVNATPE